MVLSIGSIGLLYWLIRHQAATSVASLFYLGPAVTSLMAFVLFDERLDGVAIAGMIACAAAVLLVNRRAGEDLARNHKSALRPSFETAALRPPQDEVQLVETQKPHAAGASDASVSKHGQQATHRISDSR